MGSTQNEKDMGSLNLVCPMCCGETFNNPQSLKYHLLSMTDNLYCPGCSQRSDSVMALIQHLDRCGQSVESEVSGELEQEHGRDARQELEPDTEVLMVRMDEKLPRLCLYSSRCLIILILEYQCRRDRSKFPSNCKRQWYHDSRGTPNNKSG